MPFYETQLRLFSRLSPKVTTRLALCLVVRRFMNVDEFVEKICISICLKIYLLCFLIVMTIKNVHLLIHEIKR